tara:strand:+ start:1094 stop:1693 length:600 start_codon:yes stop_codon:yes gene_type:complete
MELEEMQATWAQMSDQLEKQKQLTDKIILDMAQQRYRHKFSKLTIYESLGTVVCFTAAALIIVNFYKLDTWYLVICGIIMLLPLIGLPLLVLRSLGAIKRLNIGDKSYVQTIVDFTKAKKRLLAIQQLGIYMGFVLLLVSLPVFIKFKSNKDFFLMEKDITTYGLLLIAVIFFYFFSRWGYRCYNNITNSAESILAEME